METAETLTKKYGWKLALLECSKLHHKSYLAGDTEALERYKAIGKQLKRQAIPHICAASWRA